VVGEGVWRGVGVLLLVGVRLAVTEGVAESDTVVVAVGVGERLDVLVMDQVGDADGVIEGVGVLVGVGELVGLAVSEGVVVAVAEADGVGLALAQTAIDVPPVAAEPFEAPYAQAVQFAAPVAAHVPAAHVAQVTAAAGVPAVLAVQVPSAALRSNAKLPPAEPATHARPKREAPSVPAGGDQAALATAGMGGCESATASAALNARAKTRTSATAPVRRSDESAFPPTASAAAAPSAVRSERLELAASAPST